MVARADPHEDWPSRFPDLTDGIPPRDRLDAASRRLKTDRFERCLLSWLSDLHDTAGGTLVAIDGKSLRRSFDKATARSALHLVGARAVSRELSPGCVAVGEKGSEIAAIAELLGLIESCGAIVTIDAMGCQAEIARAVVEGVGDDIPAVKANRPTLHEGVVGHFPDHLDDDFARSGAGRHETRGKGHGRQGHRTYDVCDVPAGLADAGREAE